MREEVTLGQVWRTQNSRVKDGYEEFVRTSSMSAGFYHLHTGATDPQEPHSEDEIYCLLAGKADLRIRDDVLPMSAGTVAFVPARAPHRFENISTDIEVLVVFAPPESS
jgi:mannose-6-phosphate isomerase-like protein (cupin superfamily)